MSERFRDLPEQASWLTLSQRTVRRHACAMGAVKVGSRLLFPESKTLQWLETQALGPRRRVRAHSIAKRAPTRNTRPRDQPDRANSTYNKEPQS